MKIVYEESHVPFAGRYRSSLVVDGDKIYLYDCDGTWVLIEAKNNDIDCSEPLITNILAVC